MVYVPILLHVCPMNLGLLSLRALFSGFLQLCGVHDFPFLS